MSEFKKIDLNRVKTYAIAERASRVKLAMLGKPVSPDCNLGTFLDSLPDLLKAGDLKRIAAALAEAVAKNKKIIFMLGAHNLKVGLAPLYIDFMKMTGNLHFAGNSALSIHDLEIAFFGATSEDVLENLKDGSFGFVRETADLYSRVLKHARIMKIGLGQALGELMEMENAKYKQSSLAWNCLKNNLPLTIHSAIGTDIVNQHPQFDAAACGEASFIDFQILTNSVMEIARGGVAVNIGSAVIMPEVFLKAVAICKNINPDFGEFWTANFDMLPHYRPQQNVVSRPAALNSTGFSLTGHHEIMIPLLLAAVKTMLSARS